jgi:hypothetical protein
MTFAEFLHAVHTGEIQKDAAWRAYDIMGAALESHTRKGKKSRYVEHALKRMGMTYAGELALSEFCARYDVEPEAAPTLLAAWWLWSGIDAGRRMAVPLRGSGSGEGQNAA